MKFRIWFFFPSIFYFLFISFSSFSSAQNTSGNLDGKLINSIGEPVFAASILVLSPNMQGTRGTESNDEGFFRIINLPPGVYSVTLQHVGFQKVTLQNIRIALDKTTSLGNVLLNDKNVQMNEMIVTQERPLIDQTSTVVGSNLLREDFESLPIDRSYQSLPKLLPQINESFYGDGISFAGTTGLENKFYIDGIDVSDPAWNITGTKLPYNFIQETEVKIGGYEAEYKSALGGIINVITPSGGDKITGQAFLFYANNRFSGDAQYGDAIEPPKGGFSYYDFGLSLGGLIIKQKLWFQLSYNPSFQNEDVRIPGIGYQPDKSVSHLFAAKVSWQFSEKGQLVFNALGDPSSRNAIYLIDIGPGINGYKNADPALVDFKEGTYSLSMHGSYVFSDNLLLEASLSRLYLRYYHWPRTDVGYQQNYIDYTTGLVSGGVGEKHDNNSIRLDANVKATLTLDNHIIKTGFEFADNSLSRQSFNNQIQKVDDTTYYRYLRDQRGTIRNRIPSFFIQDSWKINNYLTLNGGIRWDGQYFINSDGDIGQKITKQFQPRIGFVYSPSEDGRQKIYGSFGRFYQELSTAVLSFYYLKDLYMSSTAYKQDPNINPNGGVLDWEMKGEFQKVIPDLQGQYFDEFSLGYEIEPIEKYKIGVRGTYRSLENGIEDGWSNDWNAFVLGNPGSGPLSEFPQMNRKYYSLELTIQKNSKDPFNFQLSYVLSRDYGNYSGLFNTEYAQWIGNGTSYFDFPDLLVNGDGLLPEDRTHVFKFFGSYKFDFGLTAGINLFYASGTPMNEFGTDANNYNIFLIQRGTAGRTPAIWDLNFRFIYNLNSLSFISQNARLILDIFHLASHRSAVDYDQQHYFAMDGNGNQIDPSSSYGRATKFQPPMSLRFGLEVNF